MGTTLTGTTPQDTYDSLIKVTDNGPISGTLKALSDGLGNDSTLSLSTTAASIAGTLSVTGNATFDTSTLFVDAAANEVGIGTITPSAKLDVDGTSYVIVANNSLGNRKIKFGVDGVAGEPTIQAALSDDTARQLLINPEGGNVGIGTSSPAAGYSLSVVGAFGAAVGGAYVEVGEFDRSLMILNHSNPSVNANLFQVQKSGTGVFTINPAGNVGIGTTAPSVRLQANTTSTTNAIIAAVVNPSAADNITKAASISFGLADTVGFGKEVAYLRAFTDGGNVVSGGLAIDVRKADNTPSEIARFTKDGLTFNGDTAAANALDDYEEGTWTMGVSFGGASVGVTTNLNTGAYTKVGNKVTVTGFLQLSSKGSSTGVAKITGLPFTIPANLNRLSAPSLWFNNITFANQFQGYCDQNSTNIDLGELTEAGVFTTLNDANFANNSEIMLSATYFV
jgi:hypothetical protein